MPRWAVPGVVTAVVAWMTWVLSVYDTLRPVDVAILISVASYAAGGLLVWWQRPDQRFGPLLLVVAACLAVPTLQQTRVPLLWTTGVALDSIFALGLAYTALRFPRERLVAPLDRWLVGWVVLGAVVFPIAITSMVAPEMAGCIGCDPGMNLLLIEPRPDLLPDVLEVFFWMIAAQATAVALRLGWKLWGATTPARRVLWPVAVPAALWFALHAVTRVIRLQTDSDPFEYNGVVAVSTALLCLVPFGVMLGLLRTRARRSRVGDLVVELNDVPTSERIRDAIVRTLGDPSAEVGFWIADSARYITAEGDRLALPVNGGREVTYIEGRGEPLAAIVHDAALRDEPALIDAVGAVARFAVENERLHAETLARLEDVRESRARIVQAGDEERRRIERNLHDGAQQRLIAVALQLGMLAEAPGAEALRPGVTAAVREVRTALNELRELAQGLHPAVLRDEGLAAAVEYLVERATVPVTLEAPPRRYAEGCEAAAYFVVSEALANIGKYAPGASASIHFTEASGELIVDVRDDGPGGATVRGGTGLRGLQDRVAAARGHLDIHSPPGGGTRVKARIPCE